MNNSEYIRQNLTDEQIAEHIFEKYCENGDCEHCPMRSECENIDEILKAKYNGDVEPKDRIVYWLEHSCDNVFYSDNSLWKQKNLESYHWRACGMCRRLSTEVSIASVYINSLCSPKVLTYICEDCYEKFCKLMNVPEHKHLEPSFNLKRAMPKHRKKPRQDYTICHHCGTKCSPKHFYCHECGTLLDR